MRSKKACLVILTHCVITVLGFHVEGDVGIIGGDVVEKIEQAPFMVSVWQGKDYVCGGAVIHPKFILTSAKCVEGMKAIPVIKLNTTHLGENKNVILANIIPHSQFNSNRSLTHNDIALIMLDKPTSVTPVELPEENTELANGDILNFFGWGATENLPFPKRLRRALLPVYDFDRCQRIWSFIPNMTPSSFCAGGFVTFKGACMNLGGRIDLGGPLLKGSKLVGIASFGHLNSCGIFPSIFTKVSYYINWINASIEEFLE